ncbi:hypothetical protein PHMEG_00011636 [Phytophthora megakarya]|uniref:DDE Tnp4 domain-containing protein n=1 Tax=Phytophthora megakarya TaxID=4795 RepID=A0A225WAR8_9STRA|nr:hypothetical protein PHMEG_00011636 [Phytophthora megakarya]
MPKPRGRQDLISEVLDFLAVAILEEELGEELSGSSPFDDWEQLIPVDSSVDELFDLLQLILSRSKHQQAPVWLQVAVALDKLGTYRSGAAKGRTKHVWGVGSGTIDLYTARVIIALNDLTSLYVKWPDSDERRSMSRRIASEGFPGCVGFIDGTTFPLAQKPSVNGECYFDRKQRYSLNAQVVRDDHRRIIAFHCGWSGSCADSTVYRHMALAKDEFKGIFFSEARWTSLREIRLQIKRKEDVQRLLQWINACVVLHNMLHALGDGWPDEKEVDDQLLPSAERFDDDETFPFRRRLKEHAVAVGRQRDHILWLRGER